MQRTAFLGACLYLGFVGQTRGDDGVHAAARVFRTNCSHCHQAPDLQFASDRAWLDQIKETA